jgi:hypothetical protein
MSLVVILQVLHFGVSTLYPALLKLLKYPLFHNIAAGRKTEPDKLLAWVNIYVCQVG